MAKQQDEGRCDIGLVGLGVMGRNLVLNMADHGFSVAGYDKDPDKVAALGEEAGQGNVLGATKVEEFMSLLRKPRAVMMLVPAGEAVDSVIRDLSSYLDSKDVVIDAGNSHFRDTDRRSRELSAKDIRFLGVGVSGGEKGARYGPSIMPGGPKDAYERVRPLFEAAAAKVDSEPCVAWLGPGSAGHFVKMVHNGIEYGVMQLIAESYDLLRRGFGLDNDELHQVFGEWNRGRLNGYLMEITSRIFAHEDDKTGNRLIDEILGVAKQKGTGMWTSQIAMDLQVPIPTIDLAVAMRNMSTLADEREQAAAIYRRAAALGDGDREAFIAQLGDALHAAMIITYAQGLAVLTAASKEYDYGLNIDRVARIWRGGCIIRAGLLEEIYAAFHGSPDLPNLLLDPVISRMVLENQEDLRRVIGHAAGVGLPAPGLMVSLAYLDAYRSVRLPANLIQAQRDYFGSHTYERVDSEGSFHTEWEKP